MKVAEDPFKELEEEKTIQDDTSRGKNQRTTTVYNIRQYRLKIHNKTGMGHITNTEKKEWETMGGTVGGI